MSLAPSEMEMPFGKHKGELLGDIPIRYLDWVGDQDWVQEKFPELCEAIEKLQANRPRRERHEDWG